MYNVSMYISIIKLCGFVLSYKKGGATHAPAGFIVIAASVISMVNLLVVLLWKHPHNFIHVNSETPMCWIKLVIQASKTNFHFGDYSLTSYTISYDTTYDIQIITCKLVSILSATT